MAPREGKPPRMNARYLILEVTVRLLLIAVAVVLHFAAKPVVREVIGSNWENHAFPHLERDTFPPLLFTLVGLAGAAVALMVVLVTCLAWKRLPRTLIYSEAINFFLCIVLSFGLTWLFSELGKNIVGRPRPDYLSRCLATMPDLGSFHYLPRIPECDSGRNNRIIDDGRRSFPSQHASIGFAVFLPVSLFIYRKLCQIKNSGSLRVVVPLLILLVPTVISASRLHDYRHFASDIFSGAALGAVVAFLCWRFYDTIAELEYRQYVLYTPIPRHHDPWLDCETAVPPDPFRFNTPACYVKTLGTHETPGPTSTSRSAQRFESV